MASSYRRNHIHSISTIRILHYISGAFALSEQTLSTIRTTFSEIRMKCSKPYHGRTIDIAINNAQVIDSLFLNSTSAEQQQICQNTDFYLLQADNSHIGQVSCPFSGLPNFVTAKLYNHGYFTYHTQHFHIYQPDRMDCDDFPRDHHRPYVGNWQYFIR